MRVQSSHVLLSTVVLSLSLAGCGGSATCGEEECAPFVAAAVADASAVPDEPQGTLVTGFEETLLKPLMDDIQAGVRPFTEQGIGICRGERTCDEYLGTDVGELPPGKYIVMAELRVPNVGETGTWKVDFQTDCAITRTSTNGEPTTSNTDSSREYDVRYAGTERGYRLMPLRTITSPSNGGSRECTYSITSPHPDGDKQYSGSWSTPQGE